MTAPEFRPPQRNPLLVQPANVAIGAAPATRRTQALRLAPFTSLGILALVVPLLMRRQEMRPWWLAFSGLLFGLTAVGIYLSPGPVSSVWRRTLPVVSSCIAVALLHYGSGASNAYGSALVLLPVMWQAIYGSRRDTAIAVGVATVTLIGPALLLPGLDLGTDVPRAIILSLLAGVLGAVIQSLSHSLSTTDEVLNRLRAISRALYASDQPRNELCKAVAQLTGAPVAVLVERVGAEMAVTGSTGIDLTRRSTPVADLVGPERPLFGRRVALTTGEIVFELAPEPDPVIGVATPGSRLHVPIGPQDAPTGVVTAVWPETHHEPPALILGALGMVGSDAGLALERQDLLAQLDDQAHRDGLTGLPNRRAWDEMLEREIDRARRSARPLSLAVLDLDNFKAYNDLHGHLAGDEFLRSASAAWSDQLRSHDVLARWGGEEFAVVFPDSTAAEAAAVLQRLQGATPAQQSFSAGVCQLRPGDEPGSLMATADALMYEAKARGRDLILQRPEAPEVDGETTKPIPLHRRRSEGSN